MPVSGCKNRGRIAAIGTSVADSSRLATGEWRVRFSLSSSHVGMAFVLEIKLA